MDVRGDCMGKGMEMSGGKHTACFLSNQIHSTLQEQYDSKDSHVPTGEHPKVRSGMTLILAAMTSHWVFLVSVSLGPFRC